jgi:hypothetical protein
VRNKYSAVGFTQAHSGKGGGLGKINPAKVSEYGKIGFNEVRQRLSKQ